MSRLNVLDCCRSQSQLKPTIPLPRPLPTYHYPTYLPYLPTLPYPTLTLPYPTCPASMLAIPPTRGPAGTSSALLQMAMHCTIKEVLTSSAQYFWFYFGRVLFFITCTWGKIKYQFWKNQNLNSKNHKKIKNDRLLLSFLHFWQLSFHSFSISTWNLFFTVYLLYSFIHYDI